MANTLHCTPMSRSHTHILKKHLILSLWLVSTYFWCRADGGFCLCRALSAKLEICEHGVHNCDSDLCGKQTAWTLHVFFTMPSHSPRSEALRNHRNLPKTIRQTGAEAGCQASSRLFSVHSEREDPSSPHHTPNTVPTMACFGSFWY